MSQQHSKVPARPPAQASWHPFGVRVVLVVVAALATAWSFSAFSYHLRTKPVSLIATRILQGETYNLESLRPVLEYLDRMAQHDCGELRDATVIRIHAAALAQGTGGGAQSMTKAEESTRAALACAPADGYLWYSLFWLGYAKDAPEPEILPFLEMSYRLTPNESWISQFRARVALKYWSDMDPALQAMVEREFLTLGRDGQRSVASALRRADAETRGVMLQILAKLPQEQREKLAKVLDSRNITIDIPGIDYSQWYRGRR